MDISQNKKSPLAIFLLNAASHIPCCIGPHIAAQSLGAVSTFLHTPLGLGMLSIMPPAVTWLVNHFNKHSQTSCKDGQHCHAHGHAPKHNHPLRLGWWRNNSASLLIGYSIQVAGLALDYSFHDHQGHDHGGHHHQHHQLDVPCQRKHPKDSVGVFGFSHAP